MNNTGYEFDQTEGIVPIRKIIDRKYIDKAEQYAAYLKAITLTGKVTKDSRTEDDIAKDNEAIDFLRELAKCEDPALAYGFMLYNETGIMKQYWSKRCGKLRKNKTEFFNQDVYLEWIINVFKILNGDHENIHDPLYYYKPLKDGESAAKLGYKKANGAEVKISEYDIMNSFRVWWNMHCLPVLAAWLFKQDDQDGFMNGKATISIEGSYDNEDAGHHLEKEMADSVGTSNPELDATYDEIENILRKFTRAPWTTPLNANSKAGTTSYLDVMKFIVAGTCDSLSAMRKQMNLSQAVQGRAIENIKHVFEKAGITTEELAGYLNSYGTIAMDILNNVPNASFRTLQDE